MELSSTSAPTCRTGLLYVQSCTSFQRARTQKSYMAAIKICLLCYFSFSVTFDDELSSPRAFGLDCSLSVFGGVHVGKRERWCMSNVTCCASRIHHIYPRTVLSEQGYARKRAGVAVQSKLPAPSAGTP